MQCEAEMQVLFDQQPVLEALKWDNLGTRKTKLILLLGSHKYVTTLMRLTIPFLYDV